MKLVLLLNVMDLCIGRMMIMADRGASKSTAICALAALLPKIAVMVDGLYNSSPQNLDLIVLEVLQCLEQAEPLPTEQWQVPMLDLHLGPQKNASAAPLTLNKP